MRDAFGGSFMIKILIVFIMIYIGFTAIALNYAKAFKVKNKVIEYIEDNELTDFNTMTAVEWNKMEEYFNTEILGKMNYRGIVDCQGQTEYCDNGIKIVKTSFNKSEGNKLGDYYTVTTSFGWSIPFINNLLSLSGKDGNVATGYWTISGETRSIVNE